MARITDFGGTSGGNGRYENQGDQNASNTQDQALHIALGNGAPLQVPNDDFIADADITRDGQDLVLTAPDGSVVIIDGYFSADPAPMIVAPDGTALTPTLVSSFLTHHGPVQYAQVDSVVDETPVGKVSEITGDATVTHLDGTTSHLTIGSPIYQGDIVETDQDGAVNITFVDESTFAVSENARLAIDEYVYDSGSESGSTTFSVLRGLFVFTSGLIGREDPDDVQIDTPVGSIGIRGTIIAGNVDTGTITVVEGAIVLRDYSGNELTLAQQFETGRFDPQSGQVLAMGTLDSSDISHDYSTIGNVMPSLFSGFDQGGDQSATQVAANDAPAADDAAAASQSTDGGTTADDSSTATANADGTADGPAPAGDGTTQVAAADTTEGSDTQQTADGTADGSTATTTDGSGDTTQAADGTQTTTDGTNSSGDQVILASADPQAGDSFTSLDSGTSNDGGLLSGGTTTTTSGTATLGTTGGTTTSASPAGTGTTATTTSDPNYVLQPLDLEISRHVVEDSISSGQIIAVIDTTSDFPDVKYKLLDDLGGKLALQDPINGDQAIIRYTGTGTLTAGDLLNIKVGALLPDGRKTAEAFDVKVVNVNDAPTIGSIDGLPSGSPQVDENSAANTAVAQVNATDPNGDALSYSIVGGNASGAFSIDSSGVILVANSTALDFENIGSTVNLTVRVQDNGVGTLYTQQALNITINDINEAPVLSAVAPQAILDSVVNSTSITTMSATDPEGSAVTYSIFGWSAGDPFAINASTGEVTVNNSAALADTTYNLTIKASDGSLIGTTSLTINVSATPDTTAPSLLHSGVHYSGLSGLSVHATDLVMDFSETVQKGASGTITIYDESNNQVGSPISITSTNVTVTGSQVKVVLPNALSGDTTYHVGISYGAIEDSAGNAYAGIVTPSDTSYSFTTGHDTFITTVGGLDADAAYDVIEIFDANGRTDGFVSVGDVKNAVALDTDISITIYDDLGHVQNAQTIAGAGSSNESAIGIVTDSGRNHYVVGSTDGVGNGDMVVVKLDTNGNQLWSKHYDVGSYEDKAHAVTEDGSGHVVVAGTTSYPAEDHGTVLGINSSGGVAWSTDLSISSYNVSIEDVTGTSAAKYGGDVIVGGQQNDGGATGDDMMIACLDDANGNMMWAGRIDIGSATDELVAVVEDGSGNLVVAGTTDYNGSSLDCVVASLATNGSGNVSGVNWAIALGDQGSSLQTLTDIVSNSSDGTLTALGRTGNGIMIVNLDASTGAVNWAESLTSGSTITGESISVTSDGNYIVTGQDGGHLNGDALTFKVLANGMIQDHSGSPTSAGTIDGTWTLTDISSSISHDVSGALDLDVSAVSGASVVATGSDWTATMGNGSDVDHALDALAQAAGPQTELPGTSGNDTASLDFTGSSGVVSGFAGNDTILFDTAGTTVNGGSGDDLLKLQASTPDISQFFIDGGDGSDTFRFDNASSLDLSGIQGKDSPGLHNIEAIDMSGNAASQNLTLSYDSVFGMTDSNNKLVINGDSGEDSVTLDLSGHSASVDAGGGAMGAGYKDYSYTADGHTAHLYISNNVDQSNVTV